MTKVVIFDKCLKFELDIVLSEGTKWVHSPKFEYKCLRFAVPPLSELGISSGNWKGCCSSIQKQTSQVLSCRNLSHISFMG
ncbi:hypothetical protein SORBI_3007G042500 [Sorghum bicolor]|uniref:Uncharacterized protein n=1 Tax=Sorghum bicolor TaxID=4558 RepID=A0A1B6PFI4_SORBI|nr:hypothetical protein SORBI_3007G042500 [Sorghum bicolor]